MHFLSFCVFLGCEVYGNTYEKYPKHKLRYFNTLTYSNSGFGHCANKCNNATFECKSFELGTQGQWGWSGGAMVLGKLPVPGRPTIWISVGQGPAALAVGAGGGCLDIFTLIYPFSPLSPSLWETARYRLKYCLKGPLNSKQPTTQGQCRLSTATALTHPDAMLYTANGDYYNRNCA